jgi:hypothetical protein
MELRGEKMAELYKVKISGIIYVSARNKKEAIAEARENIGREKYNIQYEPEMAKKVLNKDRERIVRGCVPKKNCKDFINENTIRRNKRQKDKLERK